MWWTWRRPASCISANWNRRITHLVDFKAAFPSMSHQYMRKCTEGVGCPKVATTVLKAFYLDGTAVSLLEGRCGQASQ